MKIEILLQNVLDHNGVSQNELARRLGMSSSTINDICKSNVKLINLETFAKVAEMFDIKDINELITLVDDSDSDEGN